MGMEGIHRILSTQSIIKSVCYPLALAAALIGVLGCGGSSEVQLQSAQTARLVFSEEFNYDFPLTEVGSVALKTFTITNLGEVEATKMTGEFFTTAFGYEDGTYPGTNGTCTDLLSAGESCTVVVQFAPAWAGSFSEPLRINYFNGAEDLVTKRPTLNGVGANP